MSSLASRGALLVLPVLIPELLAKLGVGLLHRGLAQLPRDDVVVTAVGNVARHVARAATTLDATADTATATLRPARPGALAGPVLAVAAAAVRAARLALALLAAGAGPALSATVLAGAALA